jgi:hypothetical protein
MFSMFLSSYLPLFALIGVRSIDRSDLISSSCGLLIVGGAGGTFLFLRTAERKPAGIYQLLAVENSDGDVAAYAATYLLPFVTVFSGEWQDVLTLAGFIAFLGIIYVRSRLIYVNPVLALMGYHLWRVIPVTAGAEQDDPEVRWPRYLLADHTKVRTGQVISAFKVSDDLLLYNKDLTADVSRHEAFQQEA